jgi:uncharacterized protein YjdB
MAPIPTALLVPPAGITFTALGDSLRLPVAAVFATGDTILGVAVAWTSASPAIVEISRNGAFGLARSPGDAQLTARMSALTARLTARVVQVPDTIEVAPANVTMRRGETRALAATVLDRNRRPIQGAAVIWASAVPAIAAVDGSGVVTGGAVGETGILARSGNARGTARVRVEP